MGVATYQVTVDKLKSLLPNEDEMRKLLTSDGEDKNSEKED
jgi:hypothetical protein